MVHFHGWNDPAHKADIERATRQGESFYNKIAAWLEENHHGEFAAFNADTGGYVLAATSLKATRKFQEQFGDDALIYIVQIGARPIRVGRLVTPDQKQG